jgi:hypothetical protein
VGENAMSSPSAKGLPPNVEEQVLDALKEAAEHDLCQVSYDTFEGDSQESVLLRPRDVLPYVQAVLKLHFDPGINPYDGERAAVALDVRVGVLRPAGPYWWTSPTLEENDPHAVRIWDASNDRVVWTNPSAPPEPPDS